MTRLGHHWHGCYKQYRDYGHVVVLTKTRGTGSMRLRTAVQVRRMKRRWRETRLVGLAIRTMLRKPPRPSHFTR